MTGGRWERRRSIYLRAQSLPEPEQDAFVDEAVGDDPELAAEIKEMLAAARKGGQRFEPFGFSRGHFRDVELLEEIGSGGMGIVYRARQTSLDREVAVKVMREGPGVSRADQERFREEAQLACQLQHPNIVQIFATGAPDETPHFIMQYVDGPSLRDVLEDAQERATGDRGGPLEEPPDDLRPGRVAELLAGIADALHYAHEAGLIHRDVKPSNVVLDKDGRPYLLDFGIARDVGRDTRTEYPLGTLVYMSPEQARLRSATIDHRTDVYSLGIVGYELLTLRQPFDGDTEDQVVRAIQERAPTPIRQVNPRVPKDLETICLKAIEKDASDRYASARELADDLRRFLAHESPLARPLGPLGRAVRTLRRRREVRSAAATAVLVGPLVAALLWEGKAARYPRLSFRLAPADRALEVAARLRAVEVHPLYGTPAEDAEAHELGPLPVEGAKLPRGTYLLVASDAGGRVAELFAVLSEEEKDYEYSDVRLRRQVDVIGTRMARIEAGTFQHGANQEAPSDAYDGTLWPDRVELGAFYADKFEVTNAEYREFVDETGHRAPMYWPQEPAEWDAWHALGADELPVVGVSALDAEAFARWAGKRLLTRTEWERIARGPEGFLYPWGNEEPAGERRANLGPVQWGKTVEEKRQQYLERVALGGAHPQDVSADGVFDLLGNVREWTALAPELVQTDGVWARSPTARTVAGGSFGFDLDPLTELHTIPLGSMSHEMGFRCGLSVR